MSKIQEAIQNMSVEEMKQRLAAYMQNDKQWAPKPIAIEVRHRDDNDIVGTNIYDVIVLKDDGSEETIKFEDRYSKLIYIYTLMHPQGFQRYTLNKPQKNYPELTNLYFMIYKTNATRLIDYLTRAERNFDQMMSQSVNFIHRAFRGKLGCEELSIGNTRHYNGRTVIPAVYNGLKVIFAPELQ